MARGDSIFGRVDVDWHTGEKTILLRPAERDFYLIGLWLYAVKIRRDVIPGHMCSSSLLSTRCQISVNSCKRYLSKLDAIGLITIKPDGSIKVHGVKDLHQRITWRGDEPAFPIRGKQPDPYVPLNDDEKHIREEEEESLGTLISTSSLLSPTPPENPEVSQNKTGKNPPLGTISSISQFHSAKPASYESTLSLADEMISALNIPFQHSHEIEELVANHPVPWTRDIILSTRDKQQRTLEGSDNTPISDIVNYIAGAYKRKLDASGINKK